MAKDRSRDDRRSVGSHQKMMGALGRAAESNIGNKSGSIQAWRRTWAVRPTGSADDSAERAYHAGRINSETLADLKIENGAKLNHPWYDSPSSK